LGFIVTSDCEDIRIWLLFGCYKRIIAEMEGSRPDKTAIVPPSRGSESWRNSSSPNARDELGQADVIGVELIDTNECTDCRKSESPLHGGSEYREFADV